MQRLRVVERHLLPLVLATAVAGLLLPAVGEALSRVIAPLLALLMLCVSLTFDRTALRAALARPLLLALATVLVYGPMSLAGFALGRLAFGDGLLGLGVVLVGVLPTDVSAPLLVLLARGNVALATVLGAVNTALAPLLVPALFLAYTGVRLDVPVEALVLELAATVLLPTIAGVALRTRAPAVVEPLEPALSATASLAYLALVLAVVGPNAATLRAAPLAVAAVAGVALALNLTGYLLGALGGRVAGQRPDRTALLFTLAKKEFSIAALVVFSTGLPAEVALPAVVYAVVQMTTAPPVARLLARRAAQPA